MNSEITLEINSYKHNILRYEYGFYRNIDWKGRPTTGILGGDIYVEMESDSSNAVLEMLLADMDRPLQSFFLRSEPIPVFGRIIHTKDDIMFREIAFDEAYLYFHEESMSAEGNAPMITRFLISPTRLDINRTVKMDRRVSTTYGFWWEEYKEEENFKVITRVLEEGSIGEIVEVYWKDANSHQRINEFPHNGIATLCAVVKHATEGDKVNFILEFDDGTFKRFSGVVDSRGIVEVKNVKLL